ncbi:unnamed protein product [Caenorhabditis sp. 36 PRJEB53466]|nr:unnamed protein product [Caenorhabditis sp. 36 PRJEB53466]
MDSFTDNFAMESSFDRHVAAVMGFEVMQNCHVSLDRAEECDKAEEEVDLFGNGLWEDEAPKPTYDSDSEPDNFREISFFGRPHDALVFENGEGSSPFLSFGESDDSDKSSVELSDSDIELPLPQFFSPLETSTPIPQDLDASQEWEEAEWGPPIRHVCTLLGEFYDEENDVSSAYPDDDGQGYSDEYSTHVETEASEMEQEERRPVRPVRRRVAPPKRIPDYGQTCQIPGRAGPANRRPGPARSARLRPLLRKFS